MSVCLAIDIGASGGRHILGKLVDGKLQMREVYRFENGMTEVDGTFTWDVDRLTENIIRGLEECKKIGEIPDSVAIDTWGVDYVLLDENEKELLPCIAYRDARTESIPEEIDKIIPFRELYSITGIERVAFNSIYQLYCDKQSGKLDRARHILFMPDYFAYRLTGVIKNEYTIAATSSLLDAKKRTWSDEVIDRLGFPKQLFKPLAEPGEVIGEFSLEIQKRVGFNARVFACPSHDTQSAALACPTDEESIFISSGTWSLVGVELSSPVTDEAAYNASFSNEGGANGKWCVLKNIMGMWLFQSIRREIGKENYSYDDMMHLAMESGYMRAINPRDNAFLAPESMLGAIRTYLGEPDLPLGDVLKSVYLGLAESYKEMVEEIRLVTGKKVNTVCIVGGGCQDEYLNILTNKVTGCRVTAGPIEGTAAGNILMQLMAQDETFTYADAKKCIIDTFEIKEYK